MALTLIDMQRLRKDDFEAGVYDVFMKESPLSRIIPIETIGTTEVTARRRNSIPTMGWRQRGQAFPSISGSTFDTITDQTFAMGATIDIDKTDMRDKNLLEDPLAERTKEHVEAAAWTFNDAVINGDHGTNPNMPEGLKVRLATLGSSQIVYGNSSTTELVVAPSASPSTATLQIFLDKLDEAVYAVDGHKADICLTDADFIRALKSALRKLNLYKDVEPQKPYVTPSGQRDKGSEWHKAPTFSWNGVDFYDCGLKANQTDKIVGTETVNSVACRPAYFLRLGKPYFHGIQQYPMEVSKSFMTDDGVTWRTVVDWPVGFRHIHPRFAAKLAGLKVA